MMPLLLLMMMMMMMSTIVTTMTMMMCELWRVIYRLLCLCQTGSGIYCPRSHIHCWSYWRFRKIFVRCCRWREGHYLL